MNQQAGKMYANRKPDAHTTVRAGVGVIVRNDPGEILLEKRSDCGLWGLPGGRIEPGESIVEAALREVREETGLTVEIVRLLGVYSEPSERIVTFPDNVVHLIDIVLEAKAVSGELACSPESEELRFFDVTDLPEDVAPPARLPLKDFISGRVGVMG
jgi:mutator protein MutT